ncbi:MAG: VWA domain-containing protein [Phycisphaerae bacterium]|nr:VWA domain-containing protein [Phycisphaerae bacterium]
MTLDEGKRRWRLILGQADSLHTDLSTDDVAIDKALGALYDADRRAGLGASMPNVPRWLGDIRKYFPKSVVCLLQRDAMERLDLHRMLMEPELLEAVEPDVHLVSTLLSLQGVMPAKTKETARVIVRRVVDELMRKLANPTRQAVAGALNRASRSRRPRHNEIDWPRTIRANLKHYQPEYKTVIPETRIGFGRKRSSLRDVILCIDQSGSMAASVVFSGVFGAVMASIPAVRTRLVVFDTSVVDLTDHLDDPVEVLFSTQLGGGTDINRAVGYCQSQISRPTDTIFVLISDLYEGGVEKELLSRAASLVGAGVQVIVLLALSDEGAPSFDHSLAARIAGLGIPSFACTPDKFPDLMAAAINRQDIVRWASENELVSVRRQAE